jgi:hypothetical protein
MRFYLTELGSGKQQSDYPSAVQLVQTDSRLVNALLLEAPLK